MGFPFDFGDAISKAAEAAEAARKAAEDAANAAAKAASDAAGAVGDVAAGAAKAVTETAGSAAGALAEGASAVGEQIAESDVGKAVAGAADAVAHGAADAAEQIASSDAGRAVAGAAGAAGSAVAGAADAIGGGVAGAANVVGNVAVAGADAAGVAAVAAVDAVGHVASGALAAAGDVAAGVAAAVDPGIKAIAENSPEAIAKRERLKGFRDGIKQGAYLAGKKRDDFTFAYVASLVYFLRCDGEFSEEEQSWLSEELDYLRLDGGLSDGAKETIRAIADKEDLTFEDVKERLDRVGIVSLDSIAAKMLVAGDAHGLLSPEEERATELFSEYVDVRRKYVSVDDERRERDAVEKSVREYAEHLDRIDREFREHTGLQKEDVPFLVLATILQAARVLIINALTEIENAGRNNRNEVALHNAQERLFCQFDAGDGPASGRLYASKEQILTTEGVPYDANRYAGEKLGLFKGGDHRFATLGHDPAVGLIFGTSNILTNTITCVGKDRVLGIGSSIPSTYLVNYDSMGKNPRIELPIGDLAPKVTIEMLVAASKRVVDEPSAAACALLKQIIHIGTDLFTPCGIQLPFANLVLDNAHSEMLTKYVSTGDVLKVGVQAGMTVLINFLIASLHGCQAVFGDDASDYALEMHQVRTKKIILISNALATSTSVVQAVACRDPRRFDFGGAAVLVYRLFTDIRFMSRLKEEYLDAELGKIYDERVKGLL